MVGITALVFYQPSPAVAMLPSALAHLLAQEFPERAPAGQGSIYRQLGCFANFTYLAQRTGSLLARPLP